MNTKLINKSEVKSVIKVKGIFGNIAASLAMWIVGLNKVNKIYENVKEYEGVRFAEEILKYLNIECKINNEELERIPKEGPFIIVSNHPFGAIDGLAMLCKIGEVRPDTKLLTNFILSYIPNLSEYIFSVNPFTNNPGLKSSFSGLKLAKEHLERGGVLGLFPAGEVSSNKNRERIVKDIEWQDSIIKLIKGANVPVVPIYFYGKNSNFFHLIGKIHPLLRTIRLPHEIANKKNKPIQLSIGKAILPSELNEFMDIKSLGKYLWNRTYALECNIKSNEVISTIESNYTKPIAEPIKKDILESEINANNNKSLFNIGNYSCYLFDYTDIPNTITELGRRREEAFRAVGEGTGFPIDTDKYDKYYKHLVLWDNSNKEIAGAYRLGFGREIIGKKGRKGLYSHTLFNYTHKFKPYLIDSIELGRSFVSVEYQKEALPLMLLIKGLTFTVIKYPEIKHLIGPVSMSSWYPHFYQSLMIHYLKEKCSIKEFEKFARPKNPFIPNFNLVNENELLANKMSSLEKFDRFIYKLSYNKYKLPPLLKKYIKFNAKIIAYNVDPDFNNCVDGLIMLNVNEFPKSEIDLFTKEIENKTEIYKRFEIY